MSITEETNLTHEGEGEVYLVTGGEGLLGRHLAAQIRVFARKQTYKSDPSNVSYAIGDLNDKQSLLEACQNVTTIFHIASLLSSNLDMVWRVNVDGTRDLLEAAKQCKVRRFIFVGSITAVLNRTPLVDADETAPYTVDPPDKYMAAKAEAEQLVMAWGKENDIPVCTIRPSLIFGPGDRHLAPVLVPLLKSVFGHFKLGDGCVTNVVYVENAAHALLLAEERLQPGSNVCNEVFNIHDGYSINLYDLARDIGHTLGLPNADNLLKWRTPTFPVLMTAYALDWTSSLIRPLVDWTPPLRVRDILAQRLLDYKPLIDRSEALLRTKPWLQKLYDEA
ncbi:hypothetical protein BDF19DRAFT_433398 [Syncephalis fuscata]|nr:hypothetical protein BDF19DRAFT_433398 [Syncephalis fuscata]